MESDTKQILTKNLKDAFTGETTASAKYEAYCKKAKEEGYELIAKLFEAASKSESIHARNHKKVIEKLGEKVPDVKPEYTVKTTRENLEDAIKGETYEIDIMYPEFMKLSQSLGEYGKEATKSFDRLTSTSPAINARCISFKSASMAKSIALLLAATVF